MNKAPDQTERTLKETKDLKRQGILADTPKPVLAVYCVSFLIFVSGLFMSNQIPETAYLAFGLAYVSIILSTVAFMIAYVLYRSLANLVAVTTVVMNLFIVAIALKVIINA